MVRSVTWCNLSCPPGALGVTGASTTQKHNVLNHTHSNIIKTPHITGFYTFSNSPGFLTNLWTLGLDIDSQSLVLGFILDYALHSLWASMPLTLGGGIFSDQPLMSPCKRTKALKLRFSGYSWSVVCSISDLALDQLTQSHKHCRMHLEETVSIERFSRDGLCRASYTDSAQISPFGMLKHRERSYCQYRTFTI